MRILTAVPNLLAAAHLFNDMGEPMPVVAWAVTDDGRALPIVAGASLYDLKVGDTVGFDGRKDIVDVFLGRWFAGPDARRAAIGQVKDYHEGDVIFTPGSFSTAGEVTIQNSITPAAPRTEPAASGSTGPGRPPKPRPDPVGPLGMILDGTAYAKDTSFLYHEGDRKVLFVVPAGQASPKGDSFYKQTQDGAKKLSKEGVPVWAWDVVTGKVEMPQATEPASEPAASADTPTNVAASSGIDLSDLI